MTAIQDRFTVAILGWGSLIWNPAILKTKGEWSLEGPSLPIEFSRQSKNGRLTLVIDETNGVDVPTRFIISACTTLQGAILNLKEREGAKYKNRIGFVDLKSNSMSDYANEHHPIAVARIKEWGLQKGVDAVVWTALRPHFSSGEFTVKMAMVYLKNLDDAKRKIAIDYIRNAPPEVVTPLRKCVMAEFNSFGL